jgi:hypothetical protein
MDLGSGGGEGRDNLGPVFFLQDNILRDAAGTQYVTLVQDGQVSVIRYNSLNLL